MMVEAILESSQDFGMSNGVLPQWKRELLQRRAARARPPVAPPAPPPAPPPPPPPDDDEELRYGPGIVKRLKSRYLSLALREAPRRRPSVLRRAASLEHLLDERPPPAPAPRPHARPARPVSLAAPPHALAPPPPRRDSVKRARSVDALSRLDGDEPPPAPLLPPPPPPPPLPRAIRPPRRVAPLLREAERPPADVVRSTLRKFESAPPRRPAPAARVSAVLRSSTPEPRCRSPSPAAADLSAIDEPEGAATGCAKRVSRAALEGIARAGVSVRYSFPAPTLASHLPPLSATNPVLLGRARAAAAPRRVGVIRPMPATPPPPPIDVDEPDDKGGDSPRVSTPPPFDAEAPPKGEPVLCVESAPRAPSASPPSTREATPEPEDKPAPVEAPKVAARPAVNGHAAPAKCGEAKSKIGAAGIERAWTGAARTARPAGGTTSVVFNFSARKEVPDYIENDGIVLRASRRNRFKAGESGVVVLHAARGAEGGPESESEEEEAPPSPCRVRFVNDNVLINGRSSLAPRPSERAHTLKLQFDDSLTRTFEYPSETSLCEESPPAAALPANTRLASASLSRYTPCKTLADAFALGVARPAPPTAQAPHDNREADQPNGDFGENTSATDSEASGETEGAAHAAAGDARPWSEARVHATDLLF